MTNNCAKATDVLGVQFSTSADVDPRTRILRALGLFITNYAMVETAVHIYARKLIAIDDRKARILFAGITVTKLVEKISLLLALAGYGEVDRREFCELAGQLKRISAVRHLLAHNGVTFTSDQEVLSHKGFVSRDPDATQPQELTLEQLHALVDDCAFMFVRFTAITEPTVWEMGNVASLRDAAFQPWRY